MKAYTQNVSVLWLGTRPRSEGAISTPSAVLRQTRYASGSDINQPGTNPPELMAAAHAGRCRRPDALRKNQSDKFRLVNFWSTWCAPCVAEFGELVTINRMYRHRELEVVTVSVNRPDEEKRVLEFLKQKHASCRNLIFASADREKLINAFDPDWPGPVPYTVLIAPEGKVIYRESGNIDPLALKRAIVSTLNERKPR